MASHSANTHVLLINLFGNTKDTLSSSSEGVFWIAKQIQSINQDVVGEGCVRNDCGDLTINDKDKLKYLVEHYIRLLNVECERPCHEHPEVAPTLVQTPQP